MLPGRGAGEGEEDPGLAFSGSARKKRESVCTVLTVFIVLCITGRTTAGNPRDSENPARGEEDEKKTTESDQRTWCSAQLLLPDYFSRLIRARFISITT